MENLENKLLTIVTITYNRSNVLKELYQSLLNQTSMNFKWLVIDDGSEDGTSDYINTIAKSNNLFQISLVQNKNIGKYKEINRVLSMINTTLTIFIDSDDYLVSNGVDMIEHTYQKYCKNHEIGSFIFERGDGNEQIPMHKIDREFIDRRYYYLVKHKKYGDYSDVFVTDAVKEFRFPEFENEKFMSEGPLYYWFSKKYLSVFVPKILTVGAYRNGGLTKNIRRNQIKNYNGTLYETNLYLGRDTPLFFRIKEATLYNYVSLYSPKSYSSAVSLSDHKSILLLTLIPSIVVVSISKLKGI